MSAAAGGVDHAKPVGVVEPAIELEPFFIAGFGQAEFVEGGVERAVEDEFFDEDGRLQQGKFLAGRFGEVLIQVAQEAGVPGGVSKVVDQAAGVGVDLLEKRDDRAGRVAAEPVGQGMDRVMGTEDVFCGSKFGERGEYVEQIVAIGVRGVTAKIELVLVAARSRPPSPSFGPAIRGVGTSWLSSKNRTNTQLKSQATAAWVIWSDRHSVKLWAVRSAACAAVNSLPGRARRREPRPSRSARAGRPRFWEAAFVNRPRAPVAQSSFTSRTSLSISGQERCLPEAGR